jgi:hypothetical protein
MEAIVLHLFVITRKTNSLREEEIEIENQFLCNNLELKVASLDMINLLLNLNICRSYVKRLFDMIVWNFKKITY